MRVKNAQNPQGITIPQTHAKRVTSGAPKRGKDAIKHPGSIKGGRVTAKRVTSGAFGYRGAFIRATMTIELRARIAEAARKAGASVQTFVTDATLAYCKAGCPLPKEGKRQEVTRRADGYFPPYVEARFGEDAKLHQRVIDAAGEAGVPAHVLVREASAHASKGVTAKRVASSTTAKRK